MMGVIPSKRGDCQNGRFCPQTAKMAAIANLVPNSLPIWHQQISCHKKSFFLLIFFCCIVDDVMYNQCIRKRVEDEQQDDCKRVEQDGLYVEEN